MRRVFLFANNWVGWQIAGYLREEGEEIAGLALHPEGKRKYGQEIITSSGVPQERLFQADRLNESGTIGAISALGADIGVSALFGYILRTDLLDSFPAGCANVHPAYLPYNRGAYPNVWSIVEGTPAGATIHYIDQGIDTGDIIAQRPVEVEPTDTGATLYRKLEIACFELFRDTWPLIREGRAPHVKQQIAEGTTHKAADTSRIDEIDLERAYKGRELIDILRARTFSPHRGAYFISGGRRIRLSLALSYEDDCSRAD